MFCHSIVALLGANLDLKMLAIIKYMYILGYVKCIYNKKAIRAGKGKLIQSKVILK